jgi:glutamate-1-semialdehyde 2,1-aminomutase
MALPRLKANTDLNSAVADAEARFVSANPNSQARAESAKANMPGGNTRTVLHYAPFPVAFKGGEGCRLTDLDGHTYTDFLGEYTAGLYGHSNPKIMAALRTVIDGGVTLGGPNVYEAELARLMCERFPSVELVRFCNSGTEGNLYAMLTARMFTKRSHIMVFNGGYHGGAFYFGQHKPPTNAPFPWVIARYNDLEHTLAQIEAHAHELAAIVIEPMMGGGGAIAADKAFLQALRDASTRHGIVLIFDEVMSSRLSSGGLQKKLGITPDMTAFGKYLGGGMSFGAFGGRRDIMAHYDPYRKGAAPHAGTFNNNVLSMAAGIVGLRDIYTPEVAETFNAAADDFRDRLNAIMERHGLPMQTLGVGSILAMHFNGGSIKRPEDTWAKDEAGEKRQSDLLKLMHLDMMELGQYFARRGMMALSLPIGKPEFDAFEAALDEFLTVRGPVLRQALQA